MRRKEGARSKKERMFVCLIVCVCLCVFLCVCVCVCVCVNRKTETYLFCDYYYGFNISIMLFFCVFIYFIHNDMKHLFSLFIYIYLFFLTIFNIH